MNAREILLGLAIKNRGNWDMIFSDIQHKNYEDLEKYCEGYKGDYITILDSEYPDYLKQTQKPPIVLFYKGDINLLQDNMNTYCISGKRKPAQKTLKQVINACKDNEGKVLVNNLSTGVSTYALSNHYGKAIVVLASGLSNIYPQENVKLLDNVLARGGLVITEYPSFVAPEIENMQARQRIIASISRTLILIDCDRKSGSLMLANQFLLLSKDIYCVPDTDNENSACNDLIEEGATPRFDYCF